MKIISQSVNETLRIGKAIAKNLKRGDIICLFGNLGSGKTVLTKGIAAGLGIKRGEVISPTFVLLREYHNVRPLFYHFDLYRLKDWQDLLALGYEEYFYDDAATVIEWADRLGCLMPKEYLKVELAIKANKQRLIKFTPVGRHYKELWEKIRENIRN
jgi:tRNA threonylcarbamoyladenosine biosynthesis protein TsaE